MVAMLLGLLLLGGIIHVYLGTKTTYRVTEGLSRLQENTRFSIDMVARDIRMAGYIPCSQPQSSNNVVNTSASDWWRPVFQGGIQGFEAGSSTFPTSISSDVADDTDAILIRRAGKQVAAINYLDTTSDQFILQRDLGGQWIEPGSLMLACDPTHAALFQAGDISTGTTTKITISSISSDKVPGNSSVNLGRAYGNDAHLATYSPVIYYIAESISGEGNSLYREYTYVENEKTIKSRREELLEGVETMQILYGLDESGNDGVANRYVQANVVDNANAWDEVVTVRIGLLFTSEDGMRDADDLDDNTYLVANTSVDPTNDRRKRYVSSMTVSVRNTSI